MRFLLLIPVFVLFLSNVPFIQEMPMEKMMAMMQQKEKEEEKCCNKEEAESPTCPMGMDQQPGTGIPEKPMSCQPGEMPEDNSCQRTDATCICICFFQYAAPANDIKAFQFEITNTLAGRTGYVQVKWKDPHIASPGQPPDFV